MDRGRFYRFAGNLATHCDFHCDFGGRVFPLARLVAPLHRPRHLAQCHSIPGDFARRAYVCLFAVQPIYVHGQDSAIFNCQHKFK